MGKPSRTDTMSGLLTVVSVLLISLVQVGHSSLEIECNPNFRSIGSLGHNHFYVSTVPLFWHDANDTCRAYQNSYLALVPDEETKRFLLKQAGPDTRHWFGAHELRFDNWKWLNDQTFHGEMSDYTTGHIKSTCGVVNPENLHHLGQSACYPKRRFLCVKSDAHITNLRKGDYYIATKIEYHTWFTARTICQCRGMDLATANGNSTDFMYTLLNGSSEVFWIGLQKTRYVFEKTGKAISYLPFAHGEPNDWKSSEDCVMMYSGGYNDIACATKMIFFCMWENITTEPGKMSKQQQHLQLVSAAQEGHSRGGMTAAVVLTVVAVIVVVVVLTLVVLKVKAGRDGRKWWRFSNMEEEEEEEVEETDMSPGNP